MTSFVIAAVLGLFWWILISVAQTEGSTSFSFNNNSIMRQQLFEISESSF